MRGGFLILLIIVSGCCFGQNVDSLFTLYSQSKGEQRIKIANEMARIVYELECTDTLFVLSGKENPQHTDAVAYELLSGYEVYTLNDYRRGIVSALKSAELYMQTGDTASTDVMYSNAANYYGRLGDYEHAVELMHRCYEMEKQANDAEALSSTLNNMGIIYSQWGKSEIAVKYFLEAIEYERPLNRPMQYATRLSSLAKEYHLLGHYREALTLIKEALEYDNKITRNEKEERIAVHTGVLGDIYISMDSLAQAENCFRKSIEVFEKNNRQQMLATSLLSFGRLQLKKNHPGEAAATLKRCSDICEKHGFLKMQRDACRFLYEAYKQTNSASSALSALEKYKALDDSIFKETTQKQMSEFQVRYETAEKELEIERQQAEISQYRAKHTMLIIGLSLSALVLILLWVMLRLRTKRARLLAETNAAKDRFFSIISHDLKNPTIAQRDAIQLLFENVGLWDAEALRKYYQSMLRSADNQVDLLYNLLNWAQVQTGRMPYIPELFDLAVSLRTDLALLQSLADRKGIDLHIHFPEKALVTGDSDMLATVVRNLATNALKFTGEGGRVTLDVSPDGTGYTVSVSDTGIGMTEEELRNLFRIDRRQTRKGTAGEQSSGLGLIVCRELLEKHGSTLFAESEKGVGSRFWFTIFASRHL